MVDKEERKESEKDVVMESGRNELEKKCEVSVANATINTVVADELLRVKGSGAT